MAPERQKDRAIAFLALFGIAGLVASSAVGGAVAWSQYNTSSPVRSAEVQAYSHRTPVTPEVAEEIRIQERAAAEWTAAREKERLENESRDGSRND